MASLVNWDELEKLAQQDLREVPEADIQKILNALRILRERQAWQDVLKLQEMFSSMMLTQKLTLGHLRTLRDALEENAIEATHALGLKDVEARYLHDRGQFLHQVGSHEKAIQAFDRSARLYSELGQSFRALESYYMTALCYRALNQGTKAEKVLNRVLSEVKDNTWRAHPLEVLAWIELDKGNLPEVEHLLRESLQLHRESDAQNKDIMIAQVQADLGEALGLMQRYDEGVRSFQESIELLNRYPDQYDRLRARTIIKYAEMLSDMGRNAEALRMLRDVEKLISQYGAYSDLLWRIELDLARIYWRMRDAYTAALKLRVAFGIRRRLGLSNWQLIQQQITRLSAGRKFTKKHER